MLDRARFPEQLPTGAATTRLKLTGVTVTGNTVIKTEELAPIYQALVGTDTSLAEMFAVAARISALYRERGYVLSQALVPAQDIVAAGAQVRIEVLEGFIDKASASGMPAGAMDAYLQPLREQRPITLAVLERQLLLVNELPGVQARANLKAGSKPNASDLELAVDRKAVDTSINVHNRVAPSQGDVRVEAGVYVRGVLGLFDQHSVRLASSGNKQINQLSYALDLPLGASGLKGQVNASSSRSKPETVVANLDTSSDNVSIGLSYPVLRSRAANVGLRAQVGGYNNSSEAAGVVSSADRIRFVRAGVSADLVDAVGGINLLDLEWSRGLKALGASDKSDVLLNGTEPEFNRVTLYVARLQHLGGDWTLLAAVTAQQSNNRLPTAEQLGLGGETFLRGYDPSEAIGERGVAGKLELRFNASMGPVEGTWYAFADAGSVKRRLVGQPDNQTSLSSAGLGLRFSTNWRVRGYVELAKPLSDLVASKNNKDVRLFAGLGFGF